MDVYRFTPAVDGLEPRTIPSVTPAEVVAAYNRAQLNTENIREVAATVGRPRTQQSIDFLAASLPQLAAQSRADAAVLDQFRADLLARAAASPSEAATLNQYAGTVGAVQFDAIVTAGYAELFGPGFGAPPPVPPPPPPPPPPVPPDFGEDTNPLPFPLDDPNFRTIGNGVRVLDVQQGTGAAVALNDRVNVKYTGYLRSNGQIFDSNDAAPFTVNSANLIPGFADGLVGMRVGGTRRIDIPSSQAYGAAGRPGIPPNADLVFEVTLNSINPPT